MLEETHASRKRAKIIAVVNQKGGSGKTTVSMQIAGTLGIKHHAVLVVDADPQGTATRWSSAAEENKPFPAAVMNLSHSGNKIHQEIRKYMDKFDFIIVDCPPSVESTIPQAALLVADLALVPIIPALGDFWAAVGIKTLIQRVADVNTGLDSRLVVNQLQPNTIISRQLVEALKEFDIPLCQATFGFRTAYKESQAGLTVHDFGSKAEAAVEEVLALTNEVLILLSHK